MVVNFAFTPLLYFLVFKGWRFLFDRIIMCLRPCSKCPWLLLDGKKYMKHQKLLNLFCIVYNNIHEQDF